MSIHFIRNELKTERIEWNDDRNNRMKGRNGKIRETQNVYYITWTCSTLDRKDEERTLSGILFKCFFLVNVVLQRNE